MDVAWKWHERARLRRRYFLPSRRFDRRIDLTATLHLSSQVGWFTRNRAKRRTNGGAAEAQISRLAAADRAERAEADYSAAFRRKSGPVNARALSERGSDDERDTEKFDETGASDGVASYRESVCKPREPLAKPRGLPRTSLRSITGGNVERGVKTAAVRVE